MVKRSLILFTSMIFLSAFFGCQQSLESKYGKYVGEIEVSVKDDGQFPEFLAGKWEGSEAGWSLYFKPDGKLAMATIPLGKTMLVPEKINTIPTLGGIDSIYVPGDWKTTYDPDFDELTVEIVINYIRVEIESRVIEGKTEYILVGEVSEEDLTWEVTVQRYPDFKLFPNDPNDLPYMSEVMFVKVEEEK